MTQLYFPFVTEAEKAALEAARAAAMKRRRKGGSAKAAAGIARAAQATERNVPGWCDKAVERLRAFAAAQDGMFTIELARAAISADMPPPNDLRTWGAVTRMARQRLYIEAVHNAQAPAESSNGSLKPLYRRGAGA